MSYSKSKVDRAGRTLAERVRSVIEGKPITQRHRSEAQEAIQVVEWWRKEHARPLSRVAANLRYYAAEQGKPVIAQRLKKTPTISHKLLREPGMKLSRMADIGGVRAIAPTQESAYAIVRRLRRNWTITKFRDYVAEPKDDGYRALHLINRNRGRLIEVQIRTPRQDLWANSVETFARTVAPGLKFGSGPVELREYFLAIGDLFEVRDQELDIESALLDRVEEWQRRADTLLKEHAQ